MTHSFPTRRSSDLKDWPPGGPGRHVTFKTHRPPLLRQVLDREVGRQHFQEQRPVKPPVTRVKRMRKSVWLGCVSALCAIVPAQAQDQQSSFPPATPESPDDTGYEAVEAIVVTATKRSEEHTSELQSLMRLSYAVFC